MGRNMEDGSWTGKKRRSKKSSKTIDIVSYALKVSVSDVKCVFVAHFRSSDTFESLINIHASTKTCVTGNHFILQYSNSVREPCLQSCALLHLMLWNVFGVPG